MQGSHPGRGVRAGLAALALLVTPVADGRGGEPQAPPAALAEPVQEAGAVVIEGCQAFPEAELLRLMVPLAELDGAWTAPRPGRPHRELPLWALGRGASGAARLDRRAGQSIADTVTDAYAQVGLLGTRVELADAPAAADGPPVLLVRIREANPGIDPERVLRDEGPPARVAEIAFRGVSGSWLSLEELRALPLALTRVPGGYTASRPELPTTHRAVSELERPADLPIALYPSALQELLDAASRAYRERGAPGTRVRIARSALRRTLGAGSTGILEIEISEP